MNDIARLVDDLRATLDEFGAPGDGAGEMFSAPDPQVWRDLTQAAPAAHHAALAHEADSRWLGGGHADWRPGRLQPAGQERARLAAALSHWRKAHFVGCPEPLMLGSNSKWLETIGDCTAEGAAFSTAMAAAAACARQRADEARRDDQLPPDPQSEARGGVEPLMGKA